MEFRATLPRRSQHWIFVATKGNRCLLGHTFINKTSGAARLVLTAVFTQNGRIDGNGRHAKVIGQVCALLTLGGKKLSTKCGEIQSEKQEQEAWVVFGVVSSAGKEKDVKCRI